MRKFKNWLDTVHNKGLQHLMTEQLYTAVLGTIIFMLFDWGYTVINGKIFNSGVLIRTLFLLAGVAFYLSDYYYIKGSKIYRKWYFLFDFIFMICMLYMVKTVYFDIREKAALHEINMEGIRTSYLVFLFLYLIWDCRELRFSLTHDRVAVRYYYEVVLWEILSLICLLLIRDVADDHPWFLLAVLYASTIWFASISGRKENQRHSWVGANIEKGIDAGRDLMKRLFH
ncbi:MAG: hypothetical protein WCO44_02795 [Bacteroidota bacterium]